MRAREWVLQENRMENYEMEEQRQEESQEEYYDKDDWIDNWVGGGGYPGRTNRKRVNNNEYDNYNEEAQSMGFF